MLDTIINVKTLKVYDGKTVSDVAFNDIRIFQTGICHLTLTSLKVLKGTLNVVNNEMCIDTTSV